MELDKIICGDCLEILPTLPEDSIDAIVTDPPYELTSGNSKKGFMGKAWDGSGIAYNVGMWAECLRVLKPGGHMLAFGGDRTHHRMFCAIEDAGFEIRHTVVWTYGSGFPKSLDISKKLDQMAGAEREDLGPRPSAIGRTKNITGGNYGSCHNQEREMVDRITAPATPAAKQWAGFGSALKPAAEFICLARKPLAESTIAANVLRWGTGGLNIDGCRISTTDNRSRDNSKCDPDPFWNGKKRINQIIDNAGRFPANLIWSHSPNCKWIGTKKVKGDGHYPKHKKTIGDGNIYGKAKPFDAEERFLNEEEVESWDCDPSCPSWQFAKAGERKSGGSGSTLPEMQCGLFDGFRERRGGQTLPDTGSAARFFQACPFTEEDIPAFLYYAKASRAERERGLDGMPLHEQASTYGDIGPMEGNPKKVNTGHVQRISNNHPTVKPLSLMRYLCRLITPPDGVVLDPFAGSGTTCMAAKAEGFHYIGIEREAEYAEIARRRIAAIPTSLSRWEEDARQ